MHSIEQMIETFHKELAALSVVGEQFLKQPDFALGEIDAIVDEAKERGSNDFEIAAILALRYFLSLHDAMRTGTGTDMAIAWVMAIPVANKIHDLYSLKKAN